jgi:methylmalonyl-CoA/ethylmalonyl-CoA epimerase
VSQPELPANARFHHLGYACAALAKDQAQFEQLGYRLEGEPFADPIQGVAGVFLTGPGPRVELLENLPGSTTLDVWLAKGVKVYHFAYEVDDLAAALAWARAQRAVVTVAPVPAVAFGGRPITFVMLRTGLMIEFIEGPDSGATP